MTLRFHLRGIPRVGAPVATSNSPSGGRVKLPQLTCTGPREATGLSATLVWFIVTQL